MEIKLTFTETLLLQESIAARLQLIQKLMTVFSENEGTEELIKYYNGEVDKLNALQIKLTISQVIS
jgi:hypothetical protein